MKENDGRVPTGFLPELVFEEAENPVVQVISEETGEILYTVRIQGKRFKAPVYSGGKYTVKYGMGKPDAGEIVGVSVPGSGEEEELKVSF